MRDGQLALAQGAAGGAHDVLEPGADHLFGEGAGAFLPGVAGIDQLAAAQDGGGVAQRLDLVQLVGNVKDRAALGGELAQHLEQLLDFLGGEHGGRLIHDQQFWIKQQSAHDFDALALAHRQGRHGAVRIKRQAILGHDGADAGFELAGGDAGVHAQRDVFEHGQRFKQREMLEHHANAELAGSLGAGDDHRGAVPAQFARIGLHDAVDHLDQRGLAGAVFTQQGMDFAGLDRERDIVVGQHPGKTLGDASQFEAEWIVSVHALPPVTWGHGPGQVLHPVVQDGP